MDSFFAKLYEWFGLISFYSDDTDRFLRGWDYAGTGYFALHWYFYTGLAMMGVTSLIFMLQADLTGKRFNGPIRRTLVAFMVAVVNFLMAFAVPFIALVTGMHCIHLKLTFADCLGFGLSNALWAVVLFMLLSLVLKVPEG